MRFRGILTQSEAPTPAAARPGPPMRWTVEPKRQKVGQALSTLRAQIGSCKQHSQRRLTITTPAAGL